MKRLVLLLAIVMLSGCGMDLCDCGEGYEHDRDRHGARFIPEDNQRYRTAVVPQDTTGGENMPN